VTARDLWGDLCEQAGRCLDWFTCMDCDRCYCDCRCLLEFYRDEYGQGLRGHKVDTVRLKAGYL
jgi:hypothetical protein